MAAFLAFHANNTIVKIKTNYLSDCQEVNEELYEGDYRTAAIGGYLKRCYHACRPVGLSPRLSLSFQKPQVFLRRFVTYTGDEVYERSIVSPVRPIQSG